LIGFAADRRAPTPTAAAEMAVPVRAELLVDLLERERRVVGAIARLLDERRERVRALARALPDPRRLLEVASQRLDDLAEHLRRSLQVGLERQNTKLAKIAARVRPAPLRQQVARGRQDLARAARSLAVAYGRRREALAQQLAAVGGLLESLSYARVLERGYAVVRAAEGGIVASSAAATPGLGLDIEFKDGHVEAVVGTAPRRGPKGPRSGPQGQGSLL
jgi:exodeoxyribonuclease VII large subunit